MNKRERFIYFLIVLLPSVLFTISCYHFLLDRAGEKQQERMEWVASVHRNQVDQFINETKVSMDILTISLAEEWTDINHIETMLNEVAGSDPRYGGIYLLDFEGNVRVGTNDLLKQYNLRNKPYIKEAMLIKDTAVANEPETLSNNQPVIAIAVPVMKEEEIQAILVSHIRVDYIRNIMEMLTPDYGISIENTNQIPILSVSEEANEQANRTVKYPLAELPWNVVVTADELDNNHSIPLTLMIGIVAVVLLHVLFLLIKYMMLKRQTRLERVQQEAQKLELVGTLAASTAHEIRNPLTGIKGLVQLLHEKSTCPEDELYFSVIDKEIARINQIVSELLILGKPTVQHLQTADLKEIIHDVNPLIRSEANLYSVEYNVVLPEEPIFVSLHVDRMKQVLLNLAKNAFEAMNHTGQLNITVLKETSHCHIMIKDTGPGIKKEDLDLIFKPFYTSKEDGTGLGLVVCKRIIESFGGSIEIASEPGEGTLVTITLPLESPSHP